MNENEHRLAGYGDYVLIHISSHPQQRTNERPLMKLRVHSWRLDTPDSKPTHGRQLVQGRALTRGQVLRGRTGDLRSSGRALAATSQILCGRPGFRCHAWSRPIRLSASSLEKSSGIPTIPRFHPRERPLRASRDRVPRTCRPYRARKFHKPPFT